VVYAPLNLLAVAYKLMDVLRISYRSFSRESVDIERDLSRLKALSKSHKEIKAERIHDPVNNIQLILTGKINEQTL
jgi:hypothetical protein